MNDIRTIVRFQGAPATSGGGGFPEAPTDGSYYARRNAAWTSLGSAATAASGDFASATQGVRADTAVQPGDLADVATSGEYGDLSGRPVLGTAAFASASDFATNAQGALAATAVQPESLASVATTGSYSDLSEQPTIPSTASDVGAVAASAGITSIEIVTEYPAEELNGVLYIRVPA